MHMGSLAVAGAQSPGNLVHIVINNKAHETVGGLPTAATSINYSEVAKTLGYKSTIRVTTKEELSKAVNDLHASAAEADSFDKYPVFIEVMCNLYSRGDLGRPTTSPIENRDELMKNL